MTDRFIKSRSELRRLQIQCAPEGLECSWCHKGGADDFAETLEDGIVPLHRFQCAASWAWNRAKERMN